jgi:hypothetical protein
MMRRWRGDGGYGEDEQRDGLLHKGGMKAGREREILELTT